MNLRRPPLQAAQASIRSHSTAFALAAAAALALVPAVAMAHGEGAPRPTLMRLLTRWDIDPFLLIAIAGVTWLYVSTVKRVNARHPKALFPRRRVVAFLVGMAVIVFALMSPPASYDGELFSIHMWQHILLSMIAAPLLLMGTPITLTLRAVTPRARREILLPVLHSRLLRALTFPVVAWLLFAGVMWGSHFSPLFNVALENEWAHRFEHVLYISVALMFWWPVVGMDPTPWRMPHPARMLYVFLQMPQNSFLALAIYDSGSVLYDHYATTGRTWGPTPLADQQLAGITMWIVGDLLFLAGVAFAIAGWVKHEDMESKRQDRAQARRKAAATGIEATEGGSPG